MPRPTVSPEQGASKNRPAHEVRFGSVRAVIWSNQTEGGAAMFNVTVSRSYKASDGSWRDSDSFGRQDLLPLALALQHAFAWVCSQRNSD